jgi:hypothetical protein
MFWRVAPVVLASLAVVVGFRADNAPSAVDRDLIRKGLAVWHKPDDKGRACVSCHSPQGLELAFFDFDDEDITRRVEAHLPPADAQTIVAMVHARRRQYKIYTPLNAMADRPLQPGGDVLPGDTPAARDFAFAQEIDRLVPLLTRGDVDSLAKAKEAAKQVLAINLKTLRVGIAFNRISEDGFHGLEHATIADWIPDTPPNLPPDTIKARDDYERDLSQTNLRNLIDKLQIDNARANPADQLSLNKYRALLHLQAELTHPDQNEIGPQIQFDNPYWDIAEIARTHRGMPMKQLGLPEDIRLKKEPGPPLYQQFDAMKLPWYWTGWISDPGLQHTGVNGRARTAVYFGFALLENDPYPMHCAFMFLRKQLSEAFDPSAWTRPTPQHYVMEYSSFLGARKFEAVTPADPAAAALYRRFVLNEYRTSLYLLLDETRQTRMTDLKKPELAESRQMAEYIEEQLPAQKAATEKLLAQITHAFASAQQIRD